MALPELGVLLAEDDVLEVPNADGSSAQDLAEDAALDAEAGVEVVDDFAAPSSAAPAEPAIADEDEPGALYVPSPTAAAAPVRQEAAAAAAPIAEQAPLLLPPAEPDEELMDLPNDGVVGGVAPRAAQSAAAGVVAPGAAGSGADDEWDEFMGGDEALLPGVVSADEAGSNLPAPAPTSWEAVAATEDSAKAERAEEAAVAAETARVQAVERAEEQRAADETRQREEEAAAAQRQAAVEEQRAKDDEEKARQEEEKAAAEKQAAEAAEAEAEAKAKAEAEAKAREEAAAAAAAEQAAADAEAARLRKQQEEEAARLAAEEVSPQPLEDGCSRWAALLTPWRCVAGVKAGGGGEGGGTAGGGGGGYPQSRRRVRGSRSGKGKPQHSLPALCVCLEPALASSLVRHRLRRFARRFETLLAAWPNG